MSFEDEFGSQIEALAQLEGLRKEREEMLVIRSSNSPNAVLISQRQHESNKKSLKSDLKKTTAYVKKIKTIREGIVTFTDGQTIDTNNIDYNIIKPLIWWK